MATQGPTATAKSDESGAQEIDVGVSERKVDVAKETHVSKTA
jgi:hypothetical protein